jgi:hypothetical protein
MDRGLPIAGGAAALWALPSLPTRLPLKGSIEGSMHEPPTVRPSLATAAIRSIGTFRFQQNSLPVGVGSEIIRPCMLDDCVNNAMSKAAKSFVPDGALVKPNATAPC